MNPEAPVKRQLDAYNARDLTTFVAQFSDNIKVYMPPNATPALEGKTAFAEHYQTKRFNLPNLHAQILNRMVVGNKVIDHERVSGVTETPSEVAVVYEVENSLIINVWFY
ncbi:MAG: hypothetical protein ACI8WB_001798 [Phenylobacterium sp.]|jgi:hypothetical protein